MKRLFNFVTQERRWALLFLLLWITPPLLIILVLVWVLFLVPANASLRAERIGAVWLLVSSLLVILLGTIAAGVCYWLSYRRIPQQTGLSIRLYPEGFGEIEYTLVAELFPNCQAEGLLASGFHYGVTLTTRASTSISPTFTET